MLTVGLKRLDRSFSTAFRGIKSIYQAVNTSLYENEKKRFVAFSKKVPKVFFEKKNAITERMRGYILKAPSSVRYDKRINVRPHSVKKTKSITFLDIQPLFLLC